MNRMKTLGAVLSVAVLVSSCASLPNSSEPQSLKRLDNPSSQQDSGPISGREPDLLLRDFYANSANPLKQYAQARNYLTPDANNQWKPGPETVIIDRIGMSRNSTAGADHVSYTVTGTIVGTLGEGGAYNPRNEDYRAVVTLERRDGEWRIAELPNQAIIERTELRNRYIPRDLYFFDPTGNTLVPDRRWMFAGTNTQDTALISLLLAGPSPTLAPGVMDELPNSAAYTRTNNGVYELTGLSSLSEAARRRLAAQLTWTLALAEISEPFSFSIDGDLVRNDRNNPKLSVNDFPEYNPSASGTSAGVLYALTNGKASSISDGNVVAVPGFLGTNGGIESMDVASLNHTNVAASVVTTNAEGDKKSQLYMGPVDGDSTKILTAATLTKPTFEANSQAVWTVMDGNKVMRVAQSSSSSSISQTEVDTSELGENHGDISVLRLSPTGVQAAFIVDGRVYVATVARPTAGDRKLTNVRELVPAIGDSAITLEWSVNSTLLVGTVSTDTPVWRAEVDGSSAIPLSSGNIVAPVVAVSSNSSTVFITDSRAALQLSTSGNSTYWREVPGLEGARSITIVPR
ncbi:MAG: MtrAB system accessory lipoprotein LpqB [Corynebacterium matruchotii]|jgi:lipoprotein lpqB|uniref:Lipoprotein LpqB n=3 Tax=Corynebacterium matruchotii TaxID=43768 RepID=E0DD53_9CORY|nr:MtrAB system accessory lipoprotein LpqB [Corynebacterium matruchotii]RKW24118.1 MAG: MtrAB system accessory protein LpqB [Corynebacterium sp.]EEG27827.1 putative lipoprotein LpqB [Corynebacterium matruchotii ATCC 33806]EFM50126.1 putative lipoprotein LpqB [Corynebacterium matruchotii ATCC 14266]KAB1924169.1 MtrAB system accessory protein LpqB [Corynebacterium matruchotii]QIP45814.1 MtrAB system accessory protein LpqB [Corynebacterium matruchotii]